ncbi:MAG TPA: HAMP domain-containing sensor histidine kinase, partial [Solirubrobacteraceae bacterium]|nr:HAMP domain-containing sensor histidine kinase [Solirubrobacteraceae bacterium]
MLLLALGYVALLAVIALEVPFALSLRDRVDSEVRTEATGQAAVVAAAAGDLLAPSQRAALQRLTTTAARSVRGRVLVVSPTGALLADSGGRPAGTAYASRPELRAALDGRAEQIRRPSTTLGTDLLATAAPIERGGRVVGAVRITQSVAAVADATRRVVLELALVGAAVLLLALVAGALLAGRLTRPLRRLEATARSVAAGDLGARAAEEGSAEQRSLARSFNDMTARLGRLLRSQQEFVADASHQLRTPLTGLRLRLEEARAAGTRAESERELVAATVELDRMAHVVDDLLVLGRAGERDRPPERVVLLAAAGAAAARFRGPAEERGISLRLADEAPDAAATCPPGDLDRALDALLENALLYGAGGGAVEIAVVPGGVEVRDRGPGPAAGEEEAVFERFHRGRAGRGGAPGTGLG